MSARSFDVQRVELLLEVAPHVAETAVTGAIASLAQPAEIVRSPVGRRVVVAFVGDAARHVMTVASNLDSMLVGESQIVAQLRDALRVSRESRSWAMCWDPRRCRPAGGYAARSQTSISATARSLVDDGLGLVQGPLRTRVVADQPRKGCQ
jgi:hypothetical protein